MFKAKEELQLIESKHKESQAKCQDLETELSTAKELISNVANQGECISDKAQLDALTNQLESAKSELSTTRERLKECQTVARNSENALKELRTATEQFKERTNQGFTTLRAKDERNKQALEEENRAYYPSGSF